MTEQPLGGRLVVATPGLTDGNFAHTVVLVLEHHDEGAIGLVLNRPSEAAVADALPDWATLATAPAVVFLGGPVQREAVIGLAHTSASGEDTPQILPGVGVIDLGGDPALLTDRIDDVRIFAGYAGWGGGQLEEEIAAGGWFVLDARVDDVFATYPDELWRRVLRRQGGVFTTIPTDPSRN